MKSLAFRRVNAFTFSKRFAVLAAVFVEERPYLPESELAIVVGEI